MRDESETAAPRMPCWHALGGEETLSRLDTSADGGLGEAEVEHRRARHGPNRLPEAGGGEGHCQLIAA